jgi:hypothetical protein
MTFKSKKILQKCDLEQRGDFNGAQVIGGSLLKPNLIVPTISLLCKDDKLAVFRNTTMFRSRQHFLQKTHTL